MPDPLKIEPALSEQEWRESLSSVVDSSFWRVQAPVMIALSNAALPSDHPCKLTWAKLVLLREQVEIADPDNARVLAHGAAYDQERADNDAALAFLDALESYLPPREATP